MTTTKTTLQAISLLGDILEEKEAELSISGTPEETALLNELWDVYSQLLDN